MPKFVCLNVSVWAWMSVCVPECQCVSLNVSLLPTLSFHMSSCLSFYLQHHFNSMLERKKNTLVSCISDINNLNLNHRQCRIPTTAVHTACWLGVPPLTDPTLSLFLHIFINALQLFIRFVVSFNDSIIDCVHWTVLSHFCSKRVLWIHQRSSTCNYLITNHISIWTAGVSVIKLGKWHVTFSTFLECDKWFQQVAYTMMV